MTMLFKLNGHTNNTYYFMCLNSGESEAEITWYKDDKKIKPKKNDKRVKVDWDMTEDLTSLSISNVTIEDGGNYLVKATTKEGTVKELVTVTVNEPATVRKAPSDTKEPKEAVEETIEGEEVGAAKEKPNEEKAVSSKTEAPQFEIAPEPVTVEIGGTVTLKCKVAG